MRLIGQEVDALAEHQLNEFAGERLLTGLALKCRSRPGVADRQTGKQSFNVRGNRHAAAGRAWARMKWSPSVACRCESG